MHRFFCAALVAASTLGAAGPAWSQTSSQALTAEDAVREALAGNRDLLTASASIDRARGALQAAGRLENPEFELGLSDDFAFAADGERSTSLGFAQRFPVTARLRHEKEVARSELERAEAEVRDFVRDLVAEVERAFYRVRAHDERLAVARELIASVGAVEQSTARRLRSAEASAAELGLLRIERLRLEQESAQIERDRVEANARLVRLLGRSESVRLRPEGALDPGPSALPVEAATALPVASSRPDLEAARHGIERAQAERALARSRVWEDWTLGFGYQRERGVFEPTPIGVKRDSFLTLDLTIPLPLWNRREGEIAVAEAELRRSKRAREALVLRIQEEIRAAAARVRSLRASVDAYRSRIIPEATRARDLFERGYRQGLVGVAELLQAQRQYSEGRRRNIELLGELRQATIDLEVALGSNPHLNDPRGQGGPTS